MQGLGKGVFVGVPERSRQVVGGGAVGGNAGKVLGLAAGRRADGITEPLLPLKGLRAEIGAF